MVETQAASQNKKNVLVGKSSKSYGFTYFAKKDLKKGEIVMSGLGKIINHQTPHFSVQIGYAKHFLPAKWTGRYWNHSCDPNTYIKNRPDGFPDMVALRNIKKGEEITYGYWMTEFAWIKDAEERRIKCKCRTKKCKNKILSFSGLSTKDREMLKKNKLCSKYLSTQP